jgi:hypothetical protein
MIVALALLSVAMILGGLYAAFQGWEIVVLERGWALLISGSVAAASGALLLGVTAAVARLGAVRKELVHLGDLMARAEMPAAPMPAFDTPSASSASLLAGSGAAAGASASQDRADDGEPMLPLFMRPPDARDAPEPALDRSADDARDLAGRREADDEDRDHDDGPRLRIPDYLFRARDHDERHSDAEAAVRESEGLVASEPVAEPEPVAASERTDRPEAAPEAEPEKPASPSPTIIGSYNSGDNRYIMYSDGSIEAETPDGAFRFASLDELKEFIAAGGESRTGSQAS